MNLLLLKKSSLSTFENNEFFLIIMYIKKEIAICVYLMFIKVYKGHMACDQERQKKTV